MRSYFAMVNTYFNAANEPITERLVPEPINWDEVVFPPSPKGSPPRSYTPSDVGEPEMEYLAYVPRDADPEFDQAIPSRKSDVCETCGHCKKRVNKMEAKWLKMSRERNS
jgi:hypothetical protein